MEARLAKIEDKVTSLDEGLVRVEDRVTSLNERQARMEGVLEQMSIRLNHVESDLRSNFRWTLGILIPMWVTIILTIVLV